LQLIHRPLYFSPLRGRAASAYNLAGQDIMAEENIDQKVIEIVSEQMGVDKSEITRETHFINDLNADSLDTVELVMEFEDEFELSIPDEEAEKIQTVGQAIDYIKLHQGNK
jgi:acyl carrier protein